MYNASEWILSSFMVLNKCFHCHYLKKLLCLTDLSAHLQEGPIHNNFNMQLLIYTCISRLCIIIYNCYNGLLIVHMLVCTISS